tara:strand:+ start:2050 stop:4491 length:2442 start_codon:yes stop_codon:yes gene_type:complete
MKWWEAAIAGGSQAFSDIKREQRNFAAQKALKDLDAANELKKSVSQNQIDYGGGVIFNNSDDDDFSHLGTWDKRRKILGEFRDNFKSHFYKDGEFDKLKYDSWKDNNKSGFDYLSGHWEDKIKDWYQPDKARLNSSDPAMAFYKWDYGFLKGAPDLFNTAEKANALKQLTKTSTLKYVKKETDDGPKNVLISDYFDIDEGKIEKIKAGDFQELPSPINMVDDAYLKQVIDDMKPVFMHPQYGNSEEINFYQSDEQKYFEDMKANPWKALIGQQLFDHEYSGDRLSIDEAFGQISEIAIHYNLTPEDVRNVMWMMAKKYTVKPVGNSQEAILQLPQKAEKSDIQKARYIVDASNKTMNTVNELLRLYEKAPRTGFATWSNKTLNGLFSRTGQLNQITGMISQIENDDIADENQTRWSSDLQELQTQFINLSDDEGGIADAMKNFYKVTLAFNRALTVQGGSGGGKSVSDADYDRVYKSLNFGAWTSLEQVFGTLAGLKKITYQDKVTNEIFIDERYQNYQSTMSRWFGNYWTALDAKINHYTNTLKGVEYWGENYVTDSTGEVVPAHEYQQTDGSKKPVVALPSRMQYLKHMFMGEEYPDVNPSTPIKESVWSQMTQQEKLIIRNDTGHVKHFADVFNLSEAIVGTPGENIKGNAITDNAVDTDGSEYEGFNKSFNSYRDPQKWVDSEAQMKNLNDELETIRVDMVDIIRQKKKNYPKDASLTMIDSILRTSYDYLGVKSEDKAKLKGYLKTIRLINTAIKKGAYHTSFEQLKENVGAAPKQHEDFEGYKEWMKLYGETHNELTGDPLFYEGKQ